MRTIAHYAKSAERLVADNAPAILTAVGVTGSVTTAYLTGKAAFKAAQVIADEQYTQNVRRSAGEKERELTSGEKTKLVWKLYLPAASTGLVTVGCIVGANYVGTRRTAAVAAALSLSEKAIAEYKDKVVEKIGSNKEREVRDEIAQDRVNRDYKGNQVVVVEGSGKVLVHDAYSGRFFESTIETVRKAVNDINRNIMREDSQTISDFYDMVGLEHTSVSDEFGWNNAEPLVIEWTTCQSPDNGPAAHSYDFATRPILRPWTSASFR